MFELRRGGVDGEFLVAGHFDDAFEPRYTTTKYRLNLAGETPTVTSIDDQTWEAAAVVPVTRTSIFSNYPQLEPARGHTQYAGKVFVQTGEFWVDIDDAATRLSPNKEWLILQSRTRRGNGTLYLDVFNVPTGKKLLTINAPFSHAWPDDDIAQDAWVGDQYFFIPVGERHDGYVVCEFGSAKQTNGK